MPLNHLELQSKIREFARQAASARKTMEARQAEALEWLHQCAAVPQQEVRERCKNSSDRCALPAGESVDQSFQVQTGSSACIMLAADGSQMIPSAHDAIPISLINTGLICLDTSSSQAPQVITHSVFLEDQQTGIEFDLMSEDLINLKRDVAELEIILETIRDYPQKNSLPIIALRDGSLELFHQPMENQQFQQAFTTYIKTLEKLAEEDCTLACYIDRSRATTITQMLTIFTTGQALDKKQPALPDGNLLAALLPPSRRSAIFELQSSSSSHYKDKLRIHFFYLNVSQSDKPYIVRVEIPAWVASDAGKVNRLHQVLLEQCRLMGNRPYPYLLHRAHETAVVHFDEKIKLQEILAAEMQKQGLDIPQPSHKLSAKELQNRTRM